MGRDEILFEPGRRVYFVEAFWVPFALQKGQGPLKQNLCLSDPDAQGRVSNPPLHKFRLDFWPRFLIKQKAGKEELCLELCRPFALQKGQGPLRQNLCLSDPEGQGRVSNPPLRNSAAGRIMAKRAGYSGLLRFKRDK
ncbi:MAG: hypothetical protein KDI06_16445, partial [Calditrichaeota bacterium]|nr:hypothetical protein [Calditrichota bacterium]